MNTASLDIIRCENCLISENFPGIKIGKNRKCNLCERFDSKDNDQSITDVNAQKINKILREKKGESSYDVIVAFSGGKDSSYTLYHLVKNYKVSVLAMLIDNDFVSDQAQMNARNMTSSLGVDLISLKPDTGFMRKMYWKSINSDLYSATQLARANAACLSCINLINNIVLNEAIIRKIPIIAGGYIGGQVPSET